MLQRCGNALVGGSGKAGVRELEMVFQGSEARRELQEGSWAGIPGRGRTDGRTRGLELGVREELLGELLRSREGGK